MTDDDRFCACGHHATVHTDDGYCKWCRRYCQPEGN